MGNAGTYFSTLNYTLANEDTALELAMLPEKTDTILSVAGSGGRVLPLLARNPKRVICADLSADQLALTELRLSLAREASLEDFMHFFGYPGTSSTEKQELLRRHWVDRLDLRTETRDRIRSWMQALEWQTLLYEGRWERTFAKLSRIVRMVTGTAGQGILECRTLAEQTEYLASRFPHSRWQAVLRILGNASVFNALLYRGSFPRKNIRSGWVDFYQRAYARLFAQGPARENFFLQLSFLGRLEHAEGNPIECDREIYFRAKQALQSVRVDYCQGDVLEIAAREDGKIGFVSLSDVPSYFSGDTERGFLQRIRPGLADQAQVVVRNYLHVPESCDQSAYLNRRQSYGAAIAAEKVQVYDVDVFSHQSGGGRRAE